MDILEQKLLAYIKKVPNVDLKELEREINLKEEGEDYLKNTLFNLEVKGLIYKNKNNTYCIMESKPSICLGKVHFLSSGDAIITNNLGEKVIIPKCDTDGILEKDIICAKKTHVDKKGKIYGRLDKILKRNHDQISCEVIFENGQNKLIVYNSKNISKINVKQEDINNYGVGEILLVRLTTVSSQFDGTVIKSIGHKNTPDVDEKTIAYDYGFETEFSKKTIKELEKIPSTVNIDRALKEGRKDLRQKNIFTIDGSDTKDIDDSIGIELLPNGNYKLYVSIADVSYYVKENSSINNDAYERATSVYMNDTVLPMLPPKISNGICSLHPNVNRLTKTCEMIIDKDGKVVDYDIYDSIIYSKKKMTYEEVNRILVDHEKVEGYEDFYEDLKLMNELSKLLNKVKDNRGYLSFNKTEIKANGKGQAIKFSKRTQQDGEKLIENFMLLANETVAQHIYYRGLPFIYRIHEAPDEDKVSAFLEILNELGLKFKKCKSITTNKYIQNVANQIKENFQDNEVLFELLLINTMKKAKYSNINLRHFGLALQHYTHFTSPIRRYADLKVHRLLDFYKKTYNFDYTDLDNHLREVANHCSKKSNDADKAEREAKEMRMAEYMENNIGETFEGIISDIGNTYIKVKTNEGFVGKISVDELGDEPFEYNQAHNKLIGKTTGKIYMIGSPLTIKVKEASKKARTVKFVTENEPVKKIKKKKRT